jgi:hypothetical protein
MNSMPEATFRLCSVAAGSGAAGCAAADRAKQDIEAEDLCVLFRVIRPAMEFLKHDSPSAPTLRERNTAQNVWHY